MTTLQQRPSFWRYTHGLWIWAEHTHHSNLANRRSKETTEKMLFS